MSSSDAAKATPTLDKLPIREDDDDDDLDDLDDVLDQFSAPPAPPPTATLPSVSVFASTSSSATANANANRPRTNTLATAPPTSLPGDSSTKLPDPFSSITEEEEDELGKAFAEELLKGMEGLMKEVTSGPTKENEGKDITMSEEERNKALRAAWEAMLIEDMGEGGHGGTAEEYAGSASAKAAGTEKGKTPGPSAGAGGAFQDKIKQAVDKLKESEEKLGGPSASNQPTPESIEALLKSLGGLGGLGDLSELGLDGDGDGVAGGGGGAGGDEEKELAGFLETMMNQLLSKEVLYEPLKELGDGFPAYLSNPPTPLSEEDRTRYEKQHACVKRIITLFDKPDYKDDHQVYGKEVVDLMSEMQSYGNPPPEIMGPLPSGFDGLDKLPLDGSADGCLVG
ncbi:Pex19 protein family-domain-containing protein [Crepidotus variabilis]|uniref:Pex19 protein family-domain-containing protein n=1 Tax=Crepidotus variabilis TaxID=179855 RepID=A0A9P6JTD2_9AGAR|nr:Pex19 protein family-domain-containing protein [Crepidotus variabilis]